ncbi:metal ABC transporter solute-binding protein, Zn/Mn family [Desulfonatronum thiosulfatophilum]|uniref:metal ABC transporter solute-binding protein, Zn/Mn family n=1 Tax=Desulfonatronum thiosulfatophilum TaxID=617002 RepID=UPI000B83B84F|nr:zinc ABC transporter substrate-binding protein [Desulfonatronum thiosulfatophilum]
MFFCNILFFLLFISISPAGAQPFNVFVSIAPQKYFVDRIGGGLVNVSVMVPPGASPHMYEPRPAQMRALAEAEIYFAIGVEFENAILPKISSMHPNLRIVHTDRNIEKIPMIPHHHHDHEHESEKAHGHAHSHDHKQDHGHKHDNDHGHKRGHDHKHDNENKHGHGHDQDNGHKQGHGHTHAYGDPHHVDAHNGPDTHIWLSPDLVRIQAGVILEALSALDSAHASVYEANFNSFMKDLDDLDADIRSTLSEKEGAAFMVFHPAWGYFARHYGLEQIPVEVEGKDPRAQDLQNLIQRAKAEQIRVVFVSPQFSARSAETIATAIDGEIIAIDPLAEDWMANMRLVAEKFRKAML